MEKNSITINSSILLKVGVKDPYKVELVDNLSITPELKEKALLPYLKQLFDDLSFQEEGKTAKVPRHALNEVSCIIIFLVFVVAWVDWRADVQLV